MKNHRKVRAQNVPSIYAAMHSDWYNFREMQLSDLSGYDVVVKMLLLKQLCLCLHGAR